MAKIVKADNAPDGTITVQTTDGEFEVSGRGHKTDDPAELQAALANPSLVEVEFTAEDKKAIEAEAERNAAYQRGEDPERLALVRQAQEEAGITEIAGDPAVTDEASQRSTTKRSKD